MRSRPRRYLGCGRRCRGGIGTRSRRSCRADCLYVDMPVPALAARGPDDIVKRLKMGLEPLAGYENHDGVLLSNGSDVMYEHSETWTFETGERGVLRFVTVHQGRGRENYCLERLLGHEQPRQLRAAQPLRGPGDWRRTAGYSMRRA